MVIFLTKITLVAVFQFLLATSLARGAVKIDGQMEIRWPMAPQGAAVVTLDYMCIVQSNGWKIVTQNTNSTLVRRELAGTKTNYYALNYLGVKNPTELTVRAHGFILPTEEFPLNVQNFSQIIWLAYCHSLRDSSEFHETTIPARWVYDGPKTNLTCKPIWHGDFHNVLKSLEIFNPGVIFTGSGKQIPEQIPYHTGYTAALYQTTGFTNVGSSVFPLGASWSAFLPVTGATTKDQLQASQDVSLSTTAVTIIADLTDIRPEISVLTRVVDPQFEIKSGVKDVGYLTSDGWWSPNEKRFLERAINVGLTAKIKSEELPSKNVAAVIFVLLSLLITTLAIGVYIFRVNRGSSGKS